MAENDRFLGRIFGGTYEIVVDCSRAALKILCVAATSLYGIYETSRLAQLIIEGIMSRSLGGPRGDQNITEVIKQCLLVKLQCFTDERFMEVWEDCESGELKKRLLEEFSACKIDVEGLKIDIKNLEEVNETRTRIETRKRMAIAEISTRPSPIDTPGMQGNERRISPGIIVQGGIYISVITDKKEELMQEIKQVAKKGYDVLMQEGKTAVDAVEEAVRIMENAGHFNAGVGSFLNCKGEVECDAMIMDGNTMEAGAVMAARHFTNPVSLSREVMQKTPHCALNGDGALTFAQEKGFETCDPKELINDRSTGERCMGVAAALSDTVTAVAIDVNGYLACATSTGGIPGRMKGRISDAPLVGCGGYANESGAATSSGHGEALIKMTLARDVVFNMENGLNAQESTEKSVRKMQDRVGGLGGITAIDKDGNFGKAFNTGVMIWASVKYDELNYGMYPSECNTEYV